MELIEADYAIDLSIADIARQVGVSADHLTRQFNRTLGITPSEYLRRFRFARAIELLRQQTAVGNVSRMVGFSHISHFSREFKAMFGMNPSEYARRYANHRRKKDRFSLKQMPAFFALRWGCERTTIVFRSPAFVKGGYKAK